MTLRFLRDLLFVSLVASCVSKKASDEVTSFLPGTFGYDVAFVKSYKDVIVLASAQSRVLIVGDYQGRVMSSTGGGNEGNSYGWINYELVSSSKVRPHMNAYGGEDRFWMGPEGSQYALYFKKGDPFDFDHWQTPAFIDTEPFQLASVDSTHARFTRRVAFANYQGAQFEIDIDRQIELLPASEIANAFAIEVGGLKVVGFQSNNQVINRGADWKKDSGLPSIWILGMFRPSSETAVIIPHDSTFNQQGVTDDYFGLIPPDRIDKRAGHVILKADGKYRGKVGIAPAIAKNVAGSYDRKNRILTLVKYDLDKHGDYVNSKWEVQAKPYRGDVFNSYNDGPIQDGSQLGPFYELESSSGVRELKSGESLVHRHLTAHLEGNEDALNAIARKVLGLALTDLPFAVD